MRTIDTSWTLDDQSRLLSRGGLKFRYSAIGKSDASTTMAPIRWEKQTTTGEFVEVTDADLIQQLDSALRYRLAILQGS